MASGRRQSRNFRFSKGGRPHGPRRYGCCGLKIDSCISAPTCWWGEHDEVCYNNGGFDTGCQDQRTRSAPKGRGRRQRYAVGGGPRKYSLPNMRGGNGGNGRGGECYVGCDSPWGCNCQSSEQHFYYLNPVRWQDGTIATNTWIGAFSPSTGKKVGSVYIATNTFHELPVMGQGDPSLQTWSQGYMLPGEIPVIKAHSDGQEFSTEFGILEDDGIGLQFQNLGVTFVELIIMSSMLPVKQSKSTYSRGGRVRRQQGGGLPKPWGNR